MQPKTLESYIDQVMEALTYDDFSPDNSDAIPILLRDKFYMDSPYWTKHRDDKDAFYVKFKKYGQNRECVILKFGFSPRQMELTLVDRELTVIEHQTELMFSDVWKNHMALSGALKKLMKSGLELSEKLESIS